VALIVLAVAAASAADIFSVGPVPVDANGANATAARDAARVEGQRKALRLLFERLTLAGDWPRLPRIDDATLGRLVRDFSVANEKNSATRYLADYTVRFRPDQVRMVLRNAGIPFAETPSKPLIVLPVLTQGGNSVLWDSPNPWRDAWANRKALTGLVPFVVPTGDLADVAAIDAAQAIAGDAAALQRIAEQHGGGDVLVTQATQQGSGELRALTTGTSRFGSIADMQDVRGNWRANSNEGEADFLARVADAVAREVEETWKRDNLLRGGQESTLTATVPIGGLKDWIAVRDRLAAVAAVKRTDIVSLTRTEARVDIHYMGDPKQLAVALSQRDLQLVEGTPFWTLRQSGGRS
jgi:hypothetical protein